MMFRSLINRGISVCSARICNPCQVSRLPVLTHSRSYVDYHQEIEELMTQQIPDQDIPEPVDETTYEVLNVEASGHDCCLVEHYAQFAHYLANTMSLNVFDSYALQTELTLMQIIQQPNLPERLKVKDYTIPTHKRIVQIQDLSTRNAGVFLEMLQSNLPEGVSLKIRTHMQEQYKDRFIRKEIPKSLL